MLKLRFCFASFRQKQNILKERVFTLQTLVQGQGLNQALQAFLNEKIHDQIQPLKYIDTAAITERIKQEIATNCDDLLMENTIKYLEINVMKPNFQDEVNWLLTQPPKSEFQYLLMLQFFSGLLVNNYEIFQQFKNQKSGEFNSVLVQIMEYCIMKKRQPALNKQKVEELRKYYDNCNENLKSYAALFLSKYDSLEEQKFSCHPEILLLLLQDDTSEHQFKFTINQIRAGVNQWNMLYLAQVLVQLNKYKGDPCFVDLLHQIYLERVIDQEDNKQFNFRILKNFVQVAQKNEAFGDYLIYMKLLKRLVLLQKDSNYKDKTFENVLRAMYFALRELSVKTGTPFEEIPKLMLSEEYADVKKGLEEWLSRASIPESISIVNLFQLHMPDGFCEKYLKEVQISEKLLRSVIRLLNQSQLFQLNEITCEKLENYINSFKMDYVRYLQPANLQQYSHDLVKRVVTAIINNSTDDSLIEYIHKNVSYLKNNKKQCQDIGIDFSNIAPLIRFQIDAQFSLNVDINQLGKLLSIYSVLGEIDEELLEKIKNLIPNLDQNAVAQILSQSEELREKLHDIQQNDAFLNTTMLPKTFETIDDILIGKSKCLELPYYKSKQLKKQLLEKLEKLNQIPTQQQSYDLLLSWNASDFTHDTFNTLLKVVKDNIQNYDCHHIYKLVYKLAMQQQIHPGIALQAYIKLQQIASSQISEQPDKISFIRLAILLKRIYPTLILEVQDQSSEEGQFIQKILENVFLNKQHTLSNPPKEYKEFFHLFYNHEEGFSDYYQTFEEKLESAIFGYVNGMNFIVNKDDLITELRKPAINVLKQIKLACLIARQNDNADLKELVKKNLTYIDPKTNYLFQDDLVVGFEVMRELFPNSNVMKKLEQFVLRQYDSFYEPTITYLFTESLLTMRTISTLEEKCL